MVMTLIDRGRKPSLVISARRTEERKRRMKETVEKDIRKWVVRSGNCKDYVVNSFDVTTMVEDSAGFQYGNGKCGVLTLEGYTYSYDLRYCKGDLHMAMIEMYFGKNLVDAVDVTNMERGN